MGNCIVSNWLLSFLDVYFMQLLRIHLLAIEDCINCFCSLQTNASVPLSHQFLIWMSVEGGLNLQIELRFLPRSIPPRREMPLA